MILRQKVIFLVGLVLLVLAQQGVAAICEGDKITLPNNTTLTLVLKQARSGNTLSQAKIGMAYINGAGTKQDISKGVYWLTKSANGGNIEGQYLLGKYYDLNEKNYRKAAKWLKKAANKGCTQSLAYLGLLSLSGKGGIKKNLKAGNEMLMKSAQAGYPFAQMMLGTILATGDGIKKDTKAGFSWVKRAADADFPAAEIALATLYLEGTGTKKDPEKTKEILVRLKQKGGDAGPIAANYLGWMYMKGKGVPVNKIKALEYMIFAAHFKVAHSRTLVKNLVHEVPKQKLISTCSVYMGSNIGAINAKAYIRTNPGETVIVLRKVKNSLKVFFPERSLEGFISRSCLRTKK